MDKEHWQKKGAGHRERLRERFLERGLDGFSDAEVLELLLSFGTPRKDCQGPGTCPAEPVLVFCRGARCRPGSSWRSKGSVRKTALPSPSSKQWQTVISSSGCSRNPISIPLQWYDYLVHSMRGLKVEVFTVIYLDSSLVLSIRRLLRKERSTSTASIRVRSSSGRFRTMPRRWSLLTIILPDP